MSRDTEENKIPAETRHWTARWRRYDVLPWVVAAIVLAGGGLVAGLYALWVYGHEMVVIERRMSSDDPAHRKLGAWRLLDHPREKWVRQMVSGLEGEESEADVREAFVYSLGRLGEERFLPTIEATLEFDESGFVRCAAWLAMARIDPEHFRTLAEAHAAKSADWDRLGLAQGWLALRDTRGVVRLLAFARGGDDTQREVASRALFKGLRPLMDSVGRWPLRASVAVGETWSPELVDEVAARCAEIDVQRIADGHGQFAQQMARVRNEVKRLTRARNRLANLLFER